MTIYHMVGRDAGMESGTTTRMERKRSEMSSTGKKLMIVVERKEKEMESTLTVIVLWLYSRNRWMQPCLAGKCIRLICWVTMKIENGGMWWFYWGVELRVEENNVLANKRNSCLLIWIDTWISVTIDWVDSSVGMGRDCVVSCCCSYFGCLSIMLKDVVG